MAMIAGESRAGSSRHLQDIVPRSYENQECARDLCGYGEHLSVFQTSQRSTSVWLGVEEVGQSFAHYQSAQTCNQCYVYFPVRKDYVDVYLTNVRQRPALPRILSMSHVSSGLCSNPPTFQDGCRLRSMSIVIVSRMELSFTKEVMV
ncbi:hypothetical protein BDR05DRAFT_955431, partial [Suillus weaverae]